VDDKVFNELKMRATIIPTQPRWPKPEVIHWARLHEAGNKPRETAHAAFSLMDEADRDEDLSPQGRQRKKRSIGMQAIADLQTRSRA
jgi:hypothetical protein